MTTPAAAGDALCIIPARGGSKRFPGKNLAPIAGRPLVGQAVHVARESGLFSAIAVSSDDAAVLAVAREHGADLALMRDAALATDRAQVKDVCVSVLEGLVSQGARYPLFAVLLPTSPLRTAEDLRNAFAVLVETGADCCMSLVECEHPPQRAVAITEGLVRPYFGPEYMKPAQALETLYRHDGTVICARTDAFLRDRSFYGMRVAPYLVPRVRAVDVDAPLDLAWAEFLVSTGVVSLGRSER
ncbi:MAG: acylneuraminate cytidylyltransferase family protein [Acidobacteriota bacterium]